MAHVDLAVCRGPADFNKLVVLKKVHPKLSKDEKFIAMFLDEARLAARLNHPNVVNTYDVVEKDGEYILVMEYLDGHSLADMFQRMQRRGLRLDVHLWILARILEGLHYAHTLHDYNGKSLRIVHRDVNPANVLLTYDGDVKLVDFGIAKATTALSPANLISANGKVGYLAPEQWEGIEVDARADIFAVGVMLWEALAGRRITRGKKADEVIRDRMLGKEARIREVRPGVPSVLAEICDCATARDRRERFASALAFRRAIDEFLQDSLVQPSREQIAELAQAAFRRERANLRERIEAYLDSGRPPKPITAGPRPKRKEEDTQTPLVTFRVPDGAFLPLESGAANLDRAESSSSIENVVTTLVPPVMGSVTAAPKIRQGLNGKSLVGWIAGTVMVLGCALVVFLIRPKYRRVAATPAPAASLATGVIEIRRGPDKNQEEPPPERPAANPTVVALANPVTTTPPEPIRVDDEAGASDGAPSAGAQLDRKKKSAIRGKVAAGRFPVTRVKRQVSRSVEQPERWTDEPGTDLKPEWRRKIFKQIDDANPFAP